MSLHVRDLSVVFKTPEKDVRAVDRLSLSIEAGERVALVGESGCGKTVLALSLVGLLPRNAQVTGTATFDGEDLLRTNAAKRIRGQRISICWSNAERFFNPVLPIGRQICEATCNIILRKAPVPAKGRLIEGDGFADRNRYATLSLSIERRHESACNVGDERHQRSRTAPVDEPTRA